MGLEGNRLLEVDNRILLLVGEEVSILVTAADVLHSFAVSSLGLKMDAVPGRLNQSLIGQENIGKYGKLLVNQSFLPQIYTRFRPFTKLFSSK